MVAVHHGPANLSATVLLHQGDEFLHRCLDRFTHDIVHPFDGHERIARLSGGLGPVALLPGPAAGEPFPL